MSAAEGGVWRDASSDDGGGLAQVEAAKPAKRAAAPDRPWTDDEVALLTEYYPLRGTRWCMKRLDRSDRSIWRMTRKLGLMRFWSERELTILRAEWSEMSERGLRRKLPGRTWKAIVEKAAKMGMANPNQGLVSIKAVEEASGFNHRRVMMILRASSVRLTQRVRTRIRPNATRRWVVELDEALEVIGAWVRDQGRRLNGVEMAERTGLSRHHTHQAVRLLASTRSVEGYPARVWAISPEDADAAAAMYRAARGVR